MANPFSEDLLLLFSHLLSNSNPDRDAAEEMLLYLSKSHPELLCLRTSHLLCSPLDDMRFFAAIILRQFFTPTSDFYLWSRLSPFSQFYLRIILLLSLQEERIRYVANAKSDTIAELASHLVPLHPRYPELLPFVLVPIAKREPQILVEANLRIFSRIARPLADMLVPYIPHLRSILSTCITHSTLSLDARVAAISASCSLVQSLPPENCSKFQNLLSSFGYLIVDAYYYKKKPMVVSKVLQLMIDFTGAYPNFFHCFIRELDKVMSILVSALGVSDLVEEGARYLTLEFATTLPEATKPALGMAHRMPLCWHHLLAILLNMLLDVGDSMPWHNTQPEGQEPNLSGSYTIALEYLDRFLSALGGNEVLKAAVDVLQPSLTHRDWKERHLSFIALARIFEGCTESINLKGQFHDTVITALVAAMDDFEKPCIQVSAVKALTNFIDKHNDDIRKILIRYLDKIVGKLVQLVKQGNQMVQVPAVFALTNVANAVSDKFNKYYYAVVPELMHVLRNATNETDKMFLAKLAGCISIIGLSAGKDKFGEDAHGVMSVLLLMQSSLDPDDPAIICFWEATDMICQCLDRDFLPYIDPLMEPLLESARLKPNYVISSAYSLDYMGTEAPNAEGKLFSLGDGFMPKKALFCNILLSYVKVLKEHFLPWTRKVTRALAPFIRSKYHVEVKKASARAMPELLNSAEMAIRREISQDQAELSVKLMLGFMLPMLLDGIHKEQDVETCEIILESLFQCLKMSARRLKQYQIENIVKEMKYLITSSDAREKIITGDVILQQIGACLSVLIDTRTAAFLYFFDEFSKHIVLMLVSEESVPIRRLSLRIFVDVAKKCEHEAVRYYDEYLPHLLVACDDSDPNIRQGALFGVGICAKFGGSCFEPFFPVAFEKINNVLQSPNLASSNARTHDITVSAFSSLWEFHKLRTGAKEKKLK